MANGDKPNMRDWLKLIRLPNLLIVILTQLSTYLILLRPALEKSGFTPSVSLIDFALIIAITVLVSAAGFIINDIKDIEIDKLNQQVNFIDDTISKKLAYRTMYAINIIAIILTLIGGIKTGYFIAIIITPLAIVLLYTYSTFFKCIPLIGNLIIALFCAAVVAVLWITDVQAFRYIFHMEAEGRELLNLFWVFVFIAFLTTWNREMIKDCEDHPGDALNNCRTMPVSLGLGFAKQIIIATLLFQLVMLVFVGFVWFYHLPVWLLIISGIVLLMLPLLIMLRLFSNTNKADFHTLSTLLKYYMLAGILIILSIALQYLI